MSQVGPDKKIVVSRDGKDQVCEFFRVAGEWYARSGQRLEKLERGKPTIPRNNLNFDVEADDKGIVFHDFEAGNKLSYSIEAHKEPPLLDVAKSTFAKVRNDFNAKVAALLEWIGGGQEATPV